MSAEVSPHTYFVGRRPFEAAEIYVVTATDVERFERNLDWRGTAEARMKLSDLLIRRVTSQRPSRELKARFALYVLDHLPDGGFVLDSDDVQRWLRLASDPEDFGPAKDGHGVAGSEGSSAELLLIRHMPEQRPQSNHERFGTGATRSPTGRRAGDRHYLAVVAAEARRLGRQLRPPRAARKAAAPQPRTGGLH